MGRVSAYIPELTKALPERRYHLALGSLTCGLICAGTAAELRAIAAATALALMASLRAAAAGLLCATLFLAGGIAGAQRLEAMDAPRQDLRSVSRLTARAHLLERPRPTRHGSRAEVRVISGPA